MARTHVVISDEVLGKIDGLVGPRSRSRFLEEAAREKLERAELAASLETTSGVASGRGYAHWRDRETAAAWVRTSRRTEPAS